MLLVCHVARNADAAPAVAHPPRAFVHAAGFVHARHALLVEFPVHRHVLGMGRLQFFARVHDRAHGVVSNCGGSHGRRAEVRVSARPVPHAQRLGMKRGAAPVLLRDAQQNVARHPQLVRHLGCRQRPDLELPLRRRDLRIRAANCNARVQARLQVLVHDVPTEAAVAAHAAVVRSRSPAPGLAQADPLVRHFAAIVCATVKQHVLLLNAEQGLLGYTRGLGLRAVHPGVCGVRRGAVLVVRLA